MARGTAGLRSSARALTPAGRQREMRKAIAAAMMPESDYARLRALDDVSACLRASLG